MKSQNLQNSNTSPSLEEKQLRYNRMSQEEKYKFLHGQYEVDNLSWGEIAENCGTYSNKIRRDAKKLGIKSKSRAEAQSLALKNGRHKHPTKGTKHSEETLLKISEKLANSWDNISDAEREKRSETARKQWNEKTEEEKKQFHRNGIKAIHRAAKEGSKLEKYIYTRLVEAGFKAEKHVENLIPNAKLQIDLMLPELNVVIEVDGPSHYSDIWGAEALAKNQKADAQKDGLLLGRGFVVIRLIQTKSLSEKYKRDLWDVLQIELDKIKEKFPPTGQRRIVVAVDSYDMIPAYNISATVN